MIGGKSETMITPMKTIHDLNILRYVVNFAYTNDSFSYKEQETDMSKSRRIQNLNQVENQDDSIKNNQEVWKL